MDPVPTPDPSVKILFVKRFSPLITFMGKGKDPDPYLWIRIREAQKHAVIKALCLKMLNPKHCLVLLVSLPKLSYRHTTSSFKGTTAACFIIIHCSL
jgi:hypothetical protein